MAAAVVGIAVAHLADRFERRDGREAVLVYAVILGLKTNSRGAAVSNHSASPVVAAPTVAAKIAGRIALLQRPTMRRKAGLGSRRRQFSTTIPLCSHGSFPEFTVLVYLSTVPVSIGSLDCIAALGAINAGVGGFTVGSSS